MDKIFWIEYTQATGDAVDSFISDMKRRIIDAQSECVKYIGQNNDMALLKKGEVHAYQTLIRSVELKLREEQSYARFRENTGQTD